MNRLATIAIVLLLLLAALGVPDDAAAFSATCLPGGFPDAPTPPVFTATTNAGSSSDAFTVEVWRVACQDTSGQAAVLLRATPIAPLPRVCYFDFEIFQDGQQFEAILRRSDGTSFCSSLAHAATFFFEKDSFISIPFDTTQAFTLIHSSFSSRGTILEIPAGEPLSISIISTGCNPCTAGQTAAFHIHVVNPGPPIAVELKTGIHIPGGAAITLLGIHVGDVLETGEFDIPLVNIVVSGDVPNGTYTVEAAILDPIFGTTLSRHSIGVVKQ